VSDAAVKRAVDVFANQPSGSYDDGAEERLMRAVLEDFAAQPQPGRVEGMAVRLLWRVVHDAIAGSCIESETLAAIQTFLDPVQFPPTAGGREAGHG
jgi:hypothetical protein